VRAELAQLPAVPARPAFCDGSLRVRTLQPYVSHPATLCAPPCNLMCPTLQPCVSQVRTLDESL